MASTRLDLPAKVWNGRAPCPSTRAKRLEAIAREVSAAAEPLAPVAATGPAKAGDLCCSTVTYVFDARATDTCRGSDHGGTTAYVYDSHRPLVEARDERGGATRGQYKELECWVWQIDRDGKATPCVFEPQPRPISARDGFCEQSLEPPRAGQFSHGNPHYRLRLFVDPRGGKTSYQFLTMSARFASRIRADGSPCTTRARTDA
jgi:hypothetical protein